MAENGALEFLTPLPPPQILKNPLDRTFAKTFHHQLTHFLLTR
jgi:hypothetical protein